MDPADESVTLLAVEEQPVFSLQEGQSPPWIDYEAVVSDLADDGVSAPDPFVEGLRTVVEESADRGLDLKVVYTEAPAAVYTDARDLATFLGQEYDGTILVRTPAFIGSASDTIPRHKLEAGQDDAWKVHDPVASANVFAHKITAPMPPWGALTASALVLVVVLTLVLAVVLRRRAR